MGGVALSALLALSCGGNVGDLFGKDAADIAGGGSGVGGRAGQSAAGQGDEGAASSGGSPGAVPVGVGARPGVGDPGAGSASGGGARGGDANGAGGAGIGSGSGSGGADGGGPAGAPNAAGAGPDEPPPPCDPCPCSSGAFGEPELVAGLEVAAGVDSFGPAPSADGLTLYLSSEGDQEDIFFATRPTRANRFSAVEPVLGVNDPSAADGTPFISADDTALYFFSDRPDPEAPGARDLWVATRPAAGTPFSAPGLVPGVNTAELEHLPRLSPDGLTLMFVSGRDTGNLSSNIWQTSRDNPSAPFSEPVELPGVNSDARDEGFWLSADGLTVFVASNRQSEAADMDIWVATRADANDAFGVAENLSVVNTSGIEIDPAITLDGFELFFASDRGGSMQLYRSARICE